MKACIYIYSFENQVLYVGSTNNIISRHRSHIDGNCFTDPYDETKKVIHKTPFELKAEKIGWDKIKLSIIENNIDRKDQRDREQFWYSLLKPIHNMRRPKITESERQKDLLKIEYERDDRECIKAMKV